ncbi:MAG TPA: hypothetical protein PK467_08455 [Candidatus Wallbacteria bacterium]|nr:hypothetical protein [Candidatus Wallbacteria bacterium]
MQLFKKTIVYRKNNLNERAMSLVEILIALIIGATAFFPIIKLFQEGIKDSLHSSSWTQAREVAKNNIDIVLALPFGNIARGDNLITDKNSAALFPRVEKIKGVDYTVTCKVHDLVPLCSIYTSNRSGGGVTNHYCISSKLKGITITVKWQGVGRELDYSLVTFKSDLTEGTKSDIWQWGFPQYH